MVTYRLKQPMAPGVGGCAPCCWRLNSSPCPTSDERLKITRQRSGTPLPIGVHTFKCKFNSGAVVTADGSSCFTDSYVTTIFTGFNAPYGFYIDVWGALADGAWSSSVVIELFLATAGGSGTTVTAVPESDTGLICATSIVSPQTATTDCLAATADATVTVTSAGGITIA